MIKHTIYSIKGILHQGRKLFAIFLSFILVTFLLNFIYAGTTTDTLDVSVTVNDSSGIIITGSGPIDEKTIPPVDPGAESDPVNITLLISNNNGNRWYVSLHGPAMALVSDAGVTMTQSDTSGLHFFHNTNDTLTGTRTPTLGTSTYVRGSIYQVYLAGDDEFNVFEIEIPLGLKIIAPGTQTEGAYRTVLTFTLTN